MTACAPKHSQQPWADILAAYQADSAVSQILLVKHTQGSNARAELWLKHDGQWLLEDTCSAFIGREGLGKTREGDMKTPVGELTIGTAFGILPNPGTSIPYVLATPSLYGADTPAEYYNQLVDTVLVHRSDISGEHIIDYVPAYHYGLTTSYNSDCIPGLGSCIYIHCKGTNPYTAGCVALDEPFMRHLLQVSDSNIVISIH